MKIEVAERCQQTVSAVRIMPLPARGRQASQDSPAVNRSPLENSAHRSGVLWSDAPRPNYCCSFRSSSNSLPQNAQLECRLLAACWITAASVRRCIWITAAERPKMYLDNGRGASDHIRVDNGPVASHQTQALAAQFSVFSGERERLRSSECERRAARWNSWHRLSACLLAECC